MFSAYVEIGVTASSSRSRSRAPTIVSAPQTSGSRAATPLPKTISASTKSTGNASSSACVRSCCDLAIDLRRPDRRASGRSPRHGRQSHCHPIGGLPPARFRDAGSRVGRDERGTAVAAVERGCVLREERLRLDDALDAREPTGGRVAHEHEQLRGGRETGCALDERLGAQALAALRDEVVRARPSSRGVSRPNVAQTIAKTSAADQHRARPRTAAAANSEVMPVSCRVASALGHAGRASAASAALFHRAIGWRARWTDHRSRLDNAGAFGQQCRRVRPVTAFSETIAKAYAVDGGAIDLGRGVHEATLELDAVVRLPLATMNRHGLIAGATGTGKTRTLQLLAEQLSDAGVSVFAADYKGDLSGLAAARRGRRAGAEADGRAAAAVRADLVPGRVPRARRHRRRRPGPRDGDGLRPELLGKVLARTRRSSRRLSLLFRFADERGPAPDRSRRPAGAPHLPRLGCGQGRPDRHRRRLRARRSASCCARSSSSRTAAATSSSASRSSRSPTSSARRPTGAA